MADDRRTDCRRVLGVRVTTSISIADILLAIAISVGGFVFVFDIKEKTAINANAIVSLEDTVERLERNSKDRDGTILQRLDRIEDKLDAAITREIKRNQ